MSALKRFREKRTEARQQRAFLNRYRVRLTEDERFTALSIVEIETGRIICRRWFARG